MFVTSDIFDLKRIGRFRNIDWRENLLAGVVIHGAAWRGYKVDASFLLEAAKRCGVLGEMRYAGYTRLGDKRTRSILPKSFERLARGELAGAKTAVGVLLRGTRAAVGTATDTVLFGGETSGSRRRIRGPTGPRTVPDYPYQAFDADFIFPMSEYFVEKASELLQLSVDILGAEYGYFFVRDELCGPWLYAHGIGSGLDGGRLHYEESDEIGHWADFVGEGRLWTEPWPVFRDLFQVNLISKRHTDTPIAHLGYLLDWINAQPGRGRLEDLDEGRWLWVLEDAEIVEVRPVLHEAGVLFSCRERVYRNLPQGAVDAQRMYDAQGLRHAPWVSDVSVDYPDRFCP